MSPEWSGDGVSARTRRGCAWRYSASWPCARTAARRAWSPSCSLSIARRQTPIVFRQNSQVFGSTGRGRGRRALYDAEAPAARRDMRTHSRRAPRDFSGGVSRRPRTSAPRRSRRLNAPGWPGWTWNALARPRPRASSAARVRPLVCRESVDRPRRRPRRARPSSRFWRNEVSTRRRHGVHRPGACCVDGRGSSDGARRERAPCALTDFNDWLIRRPATLFAERHVAERRIARGRPSRIFFFFFGRRRRRPSSAAVRRGVAVHHLPYRRGPIDPYRRWCHPCAAAVRPGDARRSSNSLPSAPALRRACAARTPGARVPSQRRPAAARAAQPRRTKHVFAASACAADHRVRRPAPSRNRFTLGARAAARGGERRLLRFFLFPGAPSGAGDAFPLGAMPSMLRLRATQRRKPPYRRRLTPDGAPPGRSTAAASRSARASAPAGAVAAGPQPWHHVGLSPSLGISFGLSPSLGISFGLSPSLGIGFGLRPSLGGVSTLSECLSCEGLRPEARACPASASA